MTTGKGFLLGGLIFGSSALFVGVLLGALIVGGFTFLETGHTPIPYDGEHRRIAEGLTLYDKTDGVELELSHVLTGEIEFHPYDPYAQDIFTSKSSYTQSLWIFTTGNDIEVTLTILGAGNDGITYMLGFGKHANNEISISGLGISGTMPFGTNEGFGATITL